MTDIKTRLASATDTEQWAARGASFAAKAKATKAIWFPTEPVATGKKTTTQASKKATGAAKKATDGTKKATTARRKQA
jgi:hypothetical protein